MAHTRTWDETDPSDNDDYGDGAKEIREFKTDVRERLDIDHYFPSTGDSSLIGTHRQVSFYAQVADPTDAADKAFLYCKDASGKIELFFMDEDGNAVQLTSAGGSMGGLASGTKMLFYADTAPSGWTIDDTLDDKVAFITKGSAAGGQTGGGAHSTGTWTQPDHTLITAEMPAHTHAGGVDGTAFVVWGANEIGIGSNTIYGATASKGGGGAHNHGTAWRPAAYCFIICEKD